MANKEFQVRHGLVVNNSVFVANVITGNVGIGTSAPSSTLQVIGNANITSNLIVTGVDIVPAIAHANATAIAAFNAANNAVTDYSPAFNQANAAYSLAQTAYGQANTATTYAGSAFNNANSTLVTASSAYDKANNVLITAQAAYNNANTKLSTSGGIITGDLSIVGNLSISGNSQFQNVTTLSIGDPLIYLAANNYSSDTVDIGFIANYVNATGANVHTGLYREHEDKMYYLFQGYDKEPVNNHIGQLSNNMTLAVLNADLRTSNLNLFGANAQQFIIASYDQANSAYTYAGAAFANANSTLVTASAAYAQANDAFINSSAGYDRANSAYTYAGAAFTNANNTLITASSAYAQSNAAFITASAAYAQSNSAFITAIGAFEKANTSVTDYSPAFNKANDAYVTAQSAFTQANASNTTARSAYEQANSAYIYAGAAFVNANSTLVTASAAFAQSNAAFITASAAYSAANAAPGISNTYADIVGTSANVYAASVGVGANSYATSIGTSGNSYATAVGTAGNAYASLVGTSANVYAASVGVGANTYATSVGTSGNAYALSTATSIGASSNGYTTAVGTAGNSYATAVGTSGNTYAASVGVGANAYAAIVGTSANVYAASVGVGANTYATEVGTSGNSYATAVGTSGNTYAASVGVGANTYATSVGTSANAYSTSVGTSSNAYALATATSIGTAGNAYTVSVGTSGNNYATAVGTSGNTYAVSVGTSANVYAASVGVGANAYAAAITGPAFNKANAALANATGVFAGSLDVTGQLNVASNFAHTGGIFFINNSAGAGGSSEGGEIQLANSTSPTQSLSGRVSIDIYENKLRFFETSGTNRGAFIDLSIAGGGVGSNLLAVGSATDQYARDTAGAAFNKANAALANTDGVIFSGSFRATANIEADRFISNNNGNGENIKIGDDVWIGDTNLANALRIKGQQNASIGYVLFGQNDGKLLGRDGAGALTYDSNTIWHAGNDGTGSGLDADLLDGQNGSYYTDIANSYAVVVGASANARANVVGTSANAYATDVGTSGNAYALSTATSIGTAGNSYATSVGTSGNTYAASVGVGANSYAATVGTSANVYAASVGVGANDYSTSVGTSGNTYATAVGTSGNAYALATATAIGTAGNSYATAVGTSGNSYATAVGTSGNTYAASVGVGANSYAATVGTSANAYAVTIGASANGWANTKLSASGGTITGDLSIVGSLYITGNSQFQNVTTLSIGDPLIYLAANNYVSDIVDIGFIANYVNATGANVHTGLYREHEDKMYYLFQGYDQEPINNHIGALSNNMTLAVLNADIRTSNLVLFGANAQQFIISAFAQANAAPGIANTYATAVGAAGNTFASVIAGAAHAQSNSAFITASAAFDKANATTYTSNVVISVTDNTNAALRVTQTGTGEAFRVEDSANPDSTAFIIDASGSVAIGNTAPQYKLHILDATSSQIMIQGDSTTGLLVERSSSDTTAPVVNFRKARGTSAVKSNVATGDQLGTTNYSAYDGSTTQIGAQIRGLVETYTGVDDFSGYLIFSTRPSGVANNVTERVRVQSTGNVLIGRTTSTVGQDVKLDVAGAINASGLLINTGGTTDALRITQIGTGNALLVEDSANPDSTPLVVDNAGRLVVGHTAATAGFPFGTPAIQAHGGSLGIARYNSTPANFSQIDIAKSANNTIAAHTILADTDSIGRVAFAGSDGTDFIRAAQINTFVDGTPSTGIMPGAITFATTALTGTSPTERLRINSRGNVTINRTDSTVGQNVKLDVAGAINASAVLVNGVEATSIANSYATAVGTSGNSYATAVGTAGNTYAASVGVGANAYAATVGTGANSYTTSVGTSGNAYAVTIGTSGNNYATAVGTAGNTYATSVGASANAFSNTKLANTTGTVFGGTLTISTNLAIGTGATGDTRKLDIFGGGAAANIGNNVNLIRSGVTAGGNSDYLVHDYVRVADGAASWVTASHKISRLVDVTTMGYMMFGSFHNDLITFGEAGTEYVRIDGSGNLIVGKTTSTVTAIPRVIVDIDGGINAAAVLVSGNVLIGRTTNSTVGQSVKLDVWGGINASSVLVNGSEVLQTNKTTTINTGYSVLSFGAGANIAAYGTWQPNPANGNYQYVTCNGAVTITTPPTNCAIDILFTNATNRNPGAVTFSGYTVGAGVGTYDITSGNRFILSIREINNVTTYAWYPMQ